jgi:predicted PurR-regulated permease PerM
MNYIQTKPTSYEIFAWIFIGLALLLVFSLHLFSALMSGFLVYELIHLITPLLRITQIGHKRAKMVVVGLLAALIVATLALLTWKVIVFFQNGEESILALFKKMSDILEDVRAKLPAWVADSLPESIEDISKSVMVMFRENTTAIQEAGKGIGLTLAHVIIGMALGAIISLSVEIDEDGHRPLAAALIERVKRISEAFRSIVFAQVRISLLNTSLTFLYLIVALPAVGIHLPLVKTMVAITFFIGLLPIVGNLISNTVIVVVSLSFSFTVAIWSLAFLVIVHKLEYFLNARIVGGHIHAKTWELLLAMLLMESAFGVGGLVAAPIYYAYLKKELSDRGLV